MSALANAYGFRTVCILGSIVSSVAFGISSFATSIYFLQFTFGVMGGKQHWYAFSWDDLVVHHQHTLKLHLSTSAKIHLYNYELQYMYTVQNQVPITIMHFYCTVLFALITGISDYQYTGDCFFSFTVWLWYQFLSYCFVLLTNLWMRYSSDGDELKFPPFPA